MSVIQCKMCGGGVELSEDKTYGVCEYCGSTMTLPKISDEQRAAAFNRGNHFRRIGEFDDALEVYERIVREDENDAEAHWCCALCRFGIEYVEDPDSYEYIPTCHRASFDSFLKDVDYLAAVEHSDGITRRQYQKDGAKIAEVQRGILATSRNEEPYDVFICYKDKDANGKRTRDSTMAQDIYYQLTEQGRRVFFARITLEEKAGAEYEPYIFAALHSARVMVVVGTSAENLNAVWVKNEWSRFLALMKHNRSKVILPCYRDMDPYDLPEQLKVLQSYDMSKIGFIQDLIRGIAKVLDADKQTGAAKETVVIQQTGGSNMNALLKRGYMSLEDGEWKQASDFFEEVLNQNAECAEAYLGKALAAKQCRSLTELSEKKKKISNTFRETILTACPKRRDVIAAATDRYTKMSIMSPEEISKKFEFETTYPSIKAAAEAAEDAEKQYWDHDNLMRRALEFSSGQFGEQLVNAKNECLDYFSGIVERASKSDQETKEKITQAYQKHVQETEKWCEAEFTAHLERKYSDARLAEERIQTSSQCERVLVLYSEICSYRDAAERIKTLREKCENLKQAEFQRYIEDEYQKALEQEKRADSEETYRAAASIFHELKDYKDSVIREKQCNMKAEERKMIKLRYADGCRYQRAANEPERFIWIADYFDELGGFADSKERAQACRKSAQKLWDARKSANREVKRKKRRILFEISAVILLLACVIVGYLVYENMTYQKASGLAAEENYTEAIQMFERIADYKDSKEILKELYYKHAEELLNAGDRIHAAMAFGKAAGYQDAWDRSYELWGEVVPRNTIGFNGEVFMFIKSDGSVLKVTFDGETELDQWPGSAAVSVVTTGSEYIYLNDNGVVFSRSFDGTSIEEVQNWRNIVQVCATGGRYYGLSAGGTVCGSQRGSFTAWEDVIAISCSYNHLAGLHSDGTVSVFTEYDSEVENAKYWTDIIQIVSAESSLYGLKKDGTVVAVGDSSQEYETWSGITYLSASRLRDNGTGVAGIQENGKVILSSDYSEDASNAVQNWPEVVEILSLGHYGVIGICKDGSVVHYGTDVLDRVSPEYLSSLRVLE